MKKCVVIYNPVSGKEKNKEYVEDFYTILKKYDYDLQLIYTQKKGDAAKIMKDLKQVDLVICAGGDGTLNEVVCGNLAREDRLLIGVLPLGTTNDVGKMLGYGNDYTKNLELLLQGKRHKYDIGLINNHPFVYVAAIGSLTDISYVTPRNIKRKFGRFAYMLQACKEIPKKIKQFDLKYKINGKTYQGTYTHVFITNSTSVAGKKNVYKDVKLDDRLLEVILLNAPSKFSMLKTLCCVLTSNLTKIPGVQIFKTSSAEFTFNEEEPMLWCVDGEEQEIKQSRIKINVNPDSSMLVPNINIEAIFK